MEEVKKVFDHRMYFINRCLLGKVTDDARGAGAWYDDNRGAERTVDELMPEFERHVADLGGAG